MLDAGLSEVFVSVGVKTNATVRRAAAPKNFVGDLCLVRESLYHERQFRIEQLASLTGEADVGGGDQLAAIEEVNRAVRDGARRVLAEIDEALEDIRIGRYGQCRRCGERIPWSVLLAVPRTRLCLTCQNALSDQESLPASAGKPQPRSA
jgi:DnaK suppressor protein